MYDATGDIGAASEDLDMDKVQTWKAYFDGLFNKVTEDEVCTMDCTPARESKSKPPKAIHVLAENLLTCGTANRLKGAAA